MFPQAPVQGAGIDGQADDEADPVAIGAVRRGVGHGIAHGDADEPVRHEGDISDDLDVLIAAQDALDRRTGGIEEGKGDGIEDEHADGPERLGIAGKDPGDGVDEMISHGDEPEGDDKSRHLAEHGVLPGCGVIAGADFIADDDGRRQADAPGQGVRQGRITDGGLVGGQVQRAELGHEQADDGEQARFAEDGDKDGNAQFQLVMDVMPADGPQAAPQVIGPERFHPLQDSCKEQERQPRRDGDGIARADAAHGRNGTGAEDEQAEEENRQDQVDD